MAGCSWITGESELDTADSLLPTCGETRPNGSGGGGKHGEELSPCTRKCLECASSLVPHKQREATEPLLISNIALQ